MRQYALVSIAIFAVVAIGLLLGTRSRTDQQYSLAETRRADAEPADVTPPNEAELQIDATQIVYSHYWLPKGLTSEILTLGGAYTEADFAGKAGFVYSLGSLKIPCYGSFQGWPIEQPVPRQAILDAAVYVARSLSADMEISISEQNEIVIRRSRPEQPTQSTEISDLFRAEGREEDGSSWLN